MSERERADCFEEGAAAWPGVVLSKATFATAHVASVVDPAEAYIAAAIAARTDGAVAAFEQRYGAVLDEAWLARHAGHGRLDELIAIATARRAMETATTRSTGLEGALLSQVSGAKVLGDDERAIARRALETALAAIPPPRRLALVLHVVHGVSPAELATILGVGRAAALRIVTRLREHLVDEARVALRMRASDATMLAATRDSRP